MLLDRVLREVDNLPEDLRTAIEKVLDARFAQSRV